MSYLMYLMNGLATTTNGSNSTNSSSSLEDYIALSASVVLWGVNYVPVKQFETGDGFFFQFMFAISIWSCGFAVYLVKGISNFYWLAMLGGSFWSLSNAFTVPVIKLIGIGLGMLMWNSACLLLGWAVPRYGLFGIQKEVPSLVGLNYIGLICCLLALFLFLFVNPDESELKLKKKKKGKPRLIHGEPLLGDEPHHKKRNYSSINNQNEDNDEDDEEETETSIYDRLGLSPVTKKLIGMCFAVFCGLLAAASYIPILYIESTYPNASQDQNDYAFSYNTGIFFGALILFIGYAVVNKNLPKVYPDAILPTFVAGFMWLVANTCYFGATNGLSQAITFPISNSVPCAIAFLVGVFYKEVKGWKNFLPLTIGIILSLVGSTLIGFSK